jgi:hypothetical protein
MRGRRWPTRAWCWPWWTSSASRPAPRSVDLHTAAVPVPSRAAAERPQACGRPALHRIERSVLRHPQHARHPSVPSCIRTPQPGVAREPRPQRDCFVPQPGAPRQMGSRVRITTRGMWVDENRLLNDLHAAASSAVAKVRVDLAASLVPKHRLDAFAALLLGIIPFLLRRQLTGTGERT